MINYSEVVRWQGQMTLQCFVTIVSWLDLIEDDVWTRFRLGGRL